MVYQAVIIGENFTQEKLEQMRERHTEKIFCLKQYGETISQDTIPEEYDENISEKWGEQVPEKYGDKAKYCLQVNRGILLEIRKQSDFFELHILLAGNQVRYIHSKNIILTSYNKIKENKTISLYEVLWAAGVGLDSITLLPVTNENQETSLKGLYYVEEKRAG